MTANAKKVVVNSDTFPLQDLLPQAAKSFFCGTPRSHISRVRTARYPALAGSCVRPSHCGSAGSFHLHIRAWHHVFRQFTKQVFPQFADQFRSAHFLLPLPLFLMFRSGTTYATRRFSPIWSSRAMTTACLTPPCSRSAASISPSSITESANLDLISVYPPQVLDVSVLQIPHLNPPSGTAAHPGSRCNRIGNEPLRRQLRALQIPTRHPCSSRCRSLQLTPNPAPGFSSLSRHILIRLLATVVR